MRHFAVRSLQPAACNARIAPRRASQNASAPKPRATRRAENASPPSMAQNRLPAYDTVSYIQRKGRGAPDRIAIKGAYARKGSEHGHETALWHGSSPFQRRIASSEIADLGFRREGTPSRDEGAPSPCQNAVSWPFFSRKRARRRRKADIEGPRSRISRNADGPARGGPAQEPKGRAVRRPNSDAARPRAAYGRSQRRARTARTTALALSAKCTSSSASRTFADAACRGSQKK